LRAGKRNLITDVGGLLVGNARDDELKSGTTVVLCERPAVAAVQVLGGAPGTRETDLLEPHNTVEEVNAIVLSGGSAFGLDAASGVQAALREKRIGHQVGPFHIPIVPSAILFDLLNGGKKDWGLYPPYRELGYEATNRAGPDFTIGTDGAGTGALTAILKGGLGSASQVLDNGFTIGAISAANPLGSLVVGDGPHFWAAPFEIAEEFGGLGFPSPLPETAADLRIKFRERNPRSPQPAGMHTTIAVIATDAVLTNAEAKRLAISAHDGFSRAIWPSHTPGDGDLVFALATGISGKRPDGDQFLDMCAGAAATMTRSLARGIFEATPAEGDVFPVWSSLIGN